MNIINDNKLCVESMNNILVLGATGSGKSVLVCKVIDYCINNNYKIALVDPKVVEYFEYLNYKNLAYRIAYNFYDYDELADFIVQYDSNEKLYLFIDEYLEVVFTSKKLVDAINLKNDNICVVSCCQNPYELKSEHIKSFDYAIVLRLLSKVDGILSTHIDTKNFKSGEFVIKDLKSGLETDKYVI